ncbi:hypothetical protein EJB05_32889, partial [Eragrostis curvula]
MPPPTQHTIHPYVLPSLFWSSHKAHSFLSLFLLPWSVSMACEQELVFYHLQLLPAQTNTTSVRARRPSSNPRFPISFPRDESRESKPFFIKPATGPSSISSSITASPVVFCLRRMKHVYGLN